MKTNFTVALLTIIHIIMWQLVVLVSALVAAVQLEGATVIELVMHGVGDCCADINQICPGTRFCIL